MRGPGHQECSWILAFLHGFRLRLTQVLNLAELPFDAGGRGFTEELLDFCRSSAYTPLVSKKLGNWEI